jgi:hypothetical protein
VPEASYKENGNSGVYCVVKRKFTVIISCVLLALVAIVAFVSRDGGGRRARATKSQLLIAPDGTFAVPQNDYVTMVAEMRKPTTNASPASTPLKKK